MRKLCLCFMSKPRFRFFEMMPSSWYYKLRDMAKPRRIRDNSKVFKNPQNPTSKAPKPNISSPSKPEGQNRASYYLSSKERADKLEKLYSDHPKKENFKGLDTHFPSEPLISPKLRSKAKPYYTRSNSISSVSLKNFKYHQIESSTETESTKDIIFDLVITSPEIKLRPILTKPCVKKEERRKNRGGKMIKLSSISPCNSKRRWISESLVVVKRSTNPEIDFTNSMIEMILENKITKMKDLEELLACYFSLNSKEYHDVILKVFEKIWLVFYEVRYS
ncbi:hypothetical protein LUZ60_013126 [Juncus effusus]|nr:hypothetical protein LUZ60_013126 [Juncus effusus]